MKAKPSLFAELKRRNVLRAGVLYIGAVWALAQGLAQLGPELYLPDWVVRYFLVAAGIGFPFWLAFAWFYQLTPQGLRRESEVAPDISIAHQTGRKLDHWIFGVLAVAVVLLLTDRFVVRGDPAAEGATLDRSVAVLPLANESGDTANDYFVDGLSEQLISDLTRIEALKVIGRNSSFRFHGSTESLAAIGAKLGVAHLIEGTVRQSGDRVRVVVGLVRAADGSGVWSESYDRELKDIFAVQADIAQAVATALQVKLVGASSKSGEAPRSGNVEAYQAVLQGRAIARKRTEAAMREGIALVEKAIRLDPGYAYAYALLSNMRINLAGAYLRGAEREQAYAEARRLIEQALAMAPDLPNVHSIRGQVLELLDFDYMGALAESRRALALAPGDGVAMSFLAGRLATVGELPQATELRRQAIATDPLRTDWYHSLAVYLTAQGRLEEAEQAVQRALALQSDYPWLYSQLSEIAILRDDAAAALRYAEQETDSIAREWDRAGALQIAGDPKEANAALQAIIAKYGADEPYLVAHIYAIRKQPDAMFEWLDRAWAARDANIGGLLYNPFLLAYRHDPRFAAFCRKVGLPVPGAAPALAAAANTR
jgi:TolB-like protein/tetratricopeptide (TPR) repeat protein